MPTTITSAGVTFTDTTTLTSANGVPSALKLTTARTINGVSFDGTGNITIPATSISGANVAKAWVNFNGTLATPITPRAQYNVSSVTKSGTGDYTVNFTTAMADANYAASGLAGEGSTTNRFIAGWFDTPTTTSIRVRTSDATITADDCAYVSVIIFGN